jgi:hypothetical protein
MQWQDAHGSSEHCKSYGIAVVKSRGRTNSIASPRIKKAKRMPVPDT